MDDEGSISITLQVERSRLVPAPRTDVAATNEFVPSRTATLSANTTVRVASGQTVLVSAARIDAKEESGELLILISASLLPT